MVDKLQYNLESMAPELEDYKDRGVFSRKEINIIVETRRAYEKKLLRPKKNLRDYLNYIKSEKKLSKLRKKRILERGCGQSPMDELLYRNILGIYCRALLRFNDKELIMEFSEFCVKMHFYEHLKEYFSQLCLKNTKDVELWIFCGKKLWEADDIDSARTIFLKAISICCVDTSDNNELYVEFFKTECLYSEKIIQLNREMEVDESDFGDIEKGMVALAIFQEFMGKASSYELKQCKEISKLVPGLAQRMEEMFSS